MNKLFLDAEMKLNTQLISYSYLAYSELANRNRAYVYITKYSDELKVSDIGYNTERYRTKLLRQRRVM